MTCFTWQWATLATLTATISGLPYVHGDFTPGAQRLPAHPALILRPTTSVPQFSELCSDFYSPVARQTYHNQPSMFFGVRNLFLSCSQSQVSLWSLHIYVGRVNIYFEIKFFEPSTALLVPRFSSCQYCLNSNPCLVCATAHFIWNFFIHDFALRNSMSCSARSLQFSEANTSNCMMQRNKL